MQGPGKPGDEAAIKQLLVSDKREDRVVGLRQLDGAYQEQICGRIRRWSDENGLRLTADEVVDIWRATVHSVAKNVMRTTFAFEGKLAAYLTTIARRRAIDLLRRRIKATYGLDLDKLSGPAEYPRGELLEEIKRCYDELPEKLQIVIRVDVLLFLSGGEKWATLLELTKEVNRRYGLSLKEKAVSSRRARARKKLRRLLRKRGYGE